MKISINNTELSIFEGAKVKDAVRMYYAQQGEQLPKPMPVVKDAWGHQVGTDGSLLPNTKLYIQPKNKTGIINRILTYLKNIR